MKNSANNHKNNLSTICSRNIQCKNVYCIAGNFRGRKLVQIGEKYDFCGENFRRLLAFAAQSCHTPKFCGENFRE